MTCVGVRFLCAEVFASLPVHPLSESESIICGVALPTFFSPESMHIYSCVHVCVLA